MANISRVLLVPASIATLESTPPPQTSLNAFCALRELLLQTTELSSATRVLPVNTPDNCKQFGAPPHVSALLRARNVLSTRTTPLSFRQTVWVVPRTPSPVAYLEPSTKRSVCAAMGGMASQAGLVLSVLCFMPRVCFRRVSRRVTRATTSTPTRPCVTSSPVKLPLPLSLPIPLQVGLIARGIPVLGRLSYWWFRRNHEHPNCLLHWPCQTGPPGLFCTSVDLWDS